MKDAVNVLKQIANEKFWGNIQFDFRDGEVTLVRKTETIKVQGKENTRRDQDSQP